MEDERLERTLGLSFQWGMAAWHNTCMPAGNPVIVGDGFQKDRPWFLDWNLNIWRRKIGHQRRRALHRIFGHLCVGINNFATPVGDALHRLAGERAVIRDRS